MIERIEIENFMGIKEAVCELGALNFFLGRNAQGKSSLKNAIVWCLTGSLPGIKRKDEGILIARGAKSAKVEVQWKGKTIKRYRTPSTTTGDVVPFENPKPLQVLWSSPWNVFLWIQGREGKEFLNSLLRDEGDLRAALTEALRREDLWKPELLGSVVKALETKGIEAAHREAVTLRRERKRELKALEAVQKPNPLVTVEGERFDLSKISLEKAREQKRKLQERLLVLEKEKEKADRAVGAHERLPRLKEKLADLMEREKPLLDELSHVKKLLNEAESVLEKGRRIECPLSKKPCPVPEEVDPLLAHASSRLKELESRKREMEAELKEVRTGIELIEKEIKEIESIELDVDPEALAKEMEEVRTRLQKGSALIAALEQYRSSLERHQKTMRRIQVVKEEVEFFDRLAGILDPAQGSISVLSGLNEFNARLERWTSFLGFRMRLNADLEPEVEGRPLVGLSNSEVYRAGMALIEAMAHLLGVKVLMFDDAEVLVQDVQIAFLNRVKALAEEGYQIIVFAAAKSEPKPFPGLNVFHVKAGTVEKLDALNEAA